MLAIIYFQTKFFPGDLAIIFVALKRENMNSLKVYLLPSSSHPHLEKLLKQPAVFQISRSSIQFNF